VVFAATIGIALVAGAAAAVNCLVEQKIDAVMQRTRARPLPRGEVTSMSTLVFAAIVGGAGLSILYRFVNPLTMWLTLATFVGYAVIYTVLLKPATPQNIVIGGASGAMPPVLGWAAVANDIAPHVDPEVQEERLARFMQKSAAISAAKLAAKVGQRMQVLVDSIDGNTAIARSMADAPEIDGVVLVKRAGKLQPGEFASVEITGSSDHDLEAKPTPR
jgi:hypothetical protein